MKSSIGWRGILPAISIWTACSACRDEEESKRREKRDQQRVGAPVNRKRGADIARIGLAPAAQTLRPQQGAD